MVGHLKGSAIDCPHKPATKGRCYLEYIHEQNRRYWQYECQSDASAPQTFLLREVK
jgi:hypothetical protein